LAKKQETWLGIREYSADEIAKINNHTATLEAAEQVLFVFLGGNRSQFCV
jgi:hypothetical protein